ncbi:MAG: helix-hairpin-helix domain-containing protein [Clostridia bacterium]|nr:helix-hairpin-helix domain-containing protein [Clostridia bacterium]
MNFRIFGRDIYLKMGTVVLGGAILALVLGGIGFYINQQSNGEIVFNARETKLAATESPEVSMVSPIQTPERVPDQAEIKVYVTGCVKKPGIVTLKKGMLIDDAVKAAGGFTEEADKDINLVYELNENVMLKIKSKKENQQNNKAMNEQPQTKDSKKKVPKDEKSSTGTGAEVVRDSGGAIEESKEEAPKGNGKVNINTASVEELDTLPGIGKKIAADIVSYRTKNGNFKTIQDIVKVPGIGDSKFNSIKDLIVAQ